MANCLGGILEYNLGARTPVLSFLIMKNIETYAAQLRKCLEYGFVGSIFEKRLEQLQSFADSAEFK